MQICKLIDLLGQIGKAVSAFQGAVIREVLVGQGADFVKFTPDSVSLRHVHFRGTHFALEAQIRRRRQSRPRRLGRRLR